MSLLILGGTGEAKLLAQRLHTQGLSVIYSIAGLVRQPDLSCPVISGGFSQFGGLDNYLLAHNIQHIVDLTHPYAATMSAKAMQTAHQRGIGYCRFERPAWNIATFKQAQYFQTLSELPDVLAHQQRILLTVGQVPEAVLQRLAATSQQLIIRTAVALDFPLPDNVTYLKAIGPFAYADELALLQRYQIDALVSKNSGGDATQAKITAAQTLDIPLFFLARPEIAASAETLNFISVGELEAHLLQCAPAQSFSDASSRAKHAAPDQPSNELPINE